MQKWKHEEIKVGEKVNQNETKDLALMVEKSRIVSSECLREWYAQ